MAASQNHYDVIVIGLGVMGSAAAYHLARDGRRVLAIEQFELDHKLGSSYGESRIIRYTYDHPVYTALAHHAFRLWRDLEAEAGRQVMFRTGGLDIGAADARTLVKTHEVATASGIAHEWLTAAEARRRFPQFALPDDMMVIYQPDAAYLNASDCVLTLAERARRHGATLLTNAPVQHIDVSYRAVSVRTADALYHADRLIITAGPWAQRVMKMLDLWLPLEVWRQQLVFIRPPNAEAYSPERFPVFIYHDRPWFYGLPSVGGTGLKVAIHGLNDVVDPDQCKRTTDAIEVERVQSFVRRMLPGAGDVVAETRVCLYTMTPDEHFIIDCHPAYPHVVFGAGFSGHGFKFGTLIGRILADLAQEGATSYPI
ncbi:MAG TPA: N-methyl-L-tryptophan oxidase, partial [Aggregatilineales bacterium]|nr:N-methyl-L-tryptophan oxidase [Aggregatilineales bacterium]